MRSIVDWMLLSSVLALTCAPCAASLATRPSRMEFVASPGQQQQFTITVSNSSTNSPGDTLACEMRARSFMMDPNGVPYGTPDSKPRSLVPWITITPAKFTLAGGVTQEVTVFVRVPRDAAGGYYATIEAFGQPVDRRPVVQGEAGIQFSYQSNTIVMAAVKGRSLKPEFSLKSIELARAKAGSRGGNTWSVRALVENLGTIHAIAQGTAEIKNSAGVRLWHGELRAGQGYVIPGYPREFTCLGIPDLPDGLYIAGIAIRTAGQRITLRGAQGFQVAGGTAVPSDTNGPLWAQSGGLIASPGTATITGPIRSRRYASIIISNTLKSGLAVS